MLRLWWWAAAAAAGGAGLGAAGAGGGGPRKVLSPNTMQVKSKGGGQSEREPTRSGQSGQRTPASSSASSTARRAVGGVLRTSTRELAGRAVGGILLLLHASVLMYKQQSELKTARISVRVLCFLFLVPKP